MQSPQINCKTVLIVEDDKEIRESFQDALEMEGYEVSTATNGKEALELLTHSPKPCLVLLDMMMPIMGGRELLDIMMKDVTLAPIPVFIVSVVADKENSKGAVGFLKKPADLNIRWCKKSCVN